MAPKYLLLAVYTALTLSLPVQLWAAPAGPQPAKNVETRITADDMTYSAEKQQVVFKTKVHVNRPDFQLWADKLTVHLKPAAKQANDSTKNSLPQGMAAGDIDKLVAENGVKMESDGRSGTCSKATYTVTDGVLRMEGNPRVTDGENTITGEIIKYFTKENRSEVIGGKRRVEAVFSSQTPSEKNGGKR